MTTAAVSRPAMKTLKALQAEAEYNSMDELIDDICAYIRDNHEDFMVNYGEVEEDEEEEDEESEE